VKILPVLLAALCALPTPVSAMSSMEKKWEETQKAGTDALDANKYWIAEPLLKQSVVKAGAFGMKDLRLAKSMGELGRLYTIRGRFDAAEPYLEEEVNIKQAALGLDNDVVIPAMGKLATFYLTYGTASKAVPLTEEILSVVEGKMGETRPAKTTGKVVFKKGAALEGWAGEAADNARDPLIEWAITCDALGNQYRLKENYDMAERLYKAALDVKTTVLGKEHLSLSNSYDSLGMLCMDRKEYKEAESYFRDSLNMTERIFKGGSPQTYGRLDRLAKCLIKEGKYSQAEELYKQALKIWHKDEPAKNGEDARALYALGSMYVDQHRYSEGAQTLARALRVAEETYGPASISLVPYLQRYAYALYHCGRKNDTDHLRSRSNTISGAL
jgi:tetratricopeptide (TPR) repeat protein